MYFLIYYNLFFQVKDILECTSDSIDDLAKDELLQRYSQLNKEIYNSKRSNDRMGTSAIACTDQDDVRAFETPTLNPLRMNSRHESSTIIETDMSIMAINRKIDELRSGEDDYF